MIDSLEANKAKRTRGATGNIPPSPPILGTPLWRMASENLNVMIFVNPFNSGIEEQSSEYVEEVENVVN